MSTIIINNVSAVCCDENWISQIREDVTVQTTKRPVSVFRRFPNGHVYLQKSSTSLLNSIIKTFTHCCYRTHGPTTRLPSSSWATLWYMVFNFSRAGYLFPPSAVVPKRCQRGKGGVYHFLLMYKFRLWNQLQPAAGDDGSVDLKSAGCCCCSLIPPLLTTSYAMWCWWWLWRCTIIMAGSFFNLQANKLAANGSLEQRGTGEARLNWVSAE